ncbi:DUF4276 family protein [Pararhodospirillum photometricum]|uniref:DUF4276 family protein n=1 Tax=Pararhodospirillum photometricum DSM 122 TaxID=1150469 RepID=H6SL70_PARPM|nr:DUF4276 family protein [Pararhodospirillum photometricum]CCG08735.1 Putative uncharacterized protein [Pararhodospirillum photometricum DSM 122]
MPPLVILVEEESMQIFLQEFLLPKVFGEAALGMTVLRHRGKTDLRHQIPSRLKGWPPETRFVIVHDKDQADCRALKASLLDLCRAADRPNVLVRIVCHELESWYLGDLDAVEQATQRKGLAEALRRREKYRDPDARANAKQELQELMPGYKARSGARDIGPYMDPQRNRSHSFQVFLRGVQALAAERRV